VWWLAFSAYAFARLPDRPGPPVPPGVNLLTIGWVRTYRLLVGLSLPGVRLPTWNVLAVIN
jgi:hypothetical protein